MSSIGIEFAKIHNFYDVKKFVNSYNYKEIQIFLSHHCGKSLGNHTEGLTKPATHDGIPDVRRVYGAGLKVLSGTAFKVSESTKYYADLIIQNILAKGFTVYQKVDAILAYVCLTLA